MGIQKITVKYAINMHILSTTVWIDNGSSPKDLKDSSLSDLQCKNYCENIT